VGTECEVSSEYINSVYSLTISGNTITTMISYKNCFLCTTWGV